MNSHNSINLTTVRKSTNFIDILQNANKYKRKLCI